jgi:pimeloyl-ACP methyl ester carboxylesterase
MSKTRQVRVGDYEFEVYFHEAPKKKGYLFFLHGYPDNYDTWESQIEYLKDDFGIIAPNLPGVGNSAKPALRVHYNAYRLLPALVDLVKTLVPSDKTPVQLVGHDWGAILLWALVSDKNLAGRFASYTAVSGPHPALAKDNLINKLTSGVYIDLENFFRQFSKSWYIYLFQLPFIPEFVWRTFPRMMWEMVLNQSEAGKDDKRWQYSDEEILERVINPISLYRELLQGREIPMPEKIGVPVQLIVPKRDMAITPEIYDNHYRYVTGLKIHYLDANHWVQNELPNEVSKLIYSFAADHSK